ncbi:Aspartic proteinase nepenthesin-1 [Sesamum alatum]|uniref:Aspartic proteinase nepenthesin-1 n=1 Tax=Sesamum alatum TaxID=300844 RepID=A0AAE2CDL1_9LAMI|nr:Aspartic proteinase nepenthesin-1 [Sesamum alatum]
MSRIPTLLLLCSLADLILILNSALLVNSNGLALRLIPPYSPESPLFQRNLSHEERIKRYVFQSDVRTNHLTATSSSNIRGRIDVQLFHYIVKVGIGTFKSKPPYKEYHLEMDTGSNLVWMQCEGCTKCFNQIPKPFPKEKSSSFHPILIKNMLKTYECEYEDGASTRGVLARETFYLRSNSGGLATVKNLEFGCGLYNDMQYGNYRNNKIAGIMGLGWGDPSFAKQLSPQIKGKFSYCLPVVSKKTPSTYLRFGDDIEQSKNFRSTPLYRMNISSSYYVDLQGISLNKTRLKINPKVFEFKNNGSSGGCIIDTGTPYSRIITPAFDILKLELVKYFSRFKNLKRRIGDLGLELCYERSKPEGFKNLPDLTFHLGGSQAADFVMKPEAVFEVVRQSRPMKSREYFCLAMVKNTKMSILGSHQQTNQRIVYDTMNKRLLFYQEDCSKIP